MSREVALDGGAEGLTRQSFGAARWVALSTSGNVVLSFLVFLALARLLQPDQFGLVAVAIVFIDILSIVTRGGLPELVVQTEVLEESFTDTAFWVSLGLGSLYAAGLAGLSWPIAAVLRLPDLQPILAALAPVFVLVALGSIHEGRLQRTLGFRKLAIRALASNLIAGTAAVGLAFAGYGVWALVAQRLFAAATTTLFNWAAFPWRPRFRLDLAAARAQLGFGTRVFSTNLFLTFSIRSQEVIAAYFLSTADIGLLRLAWRCIDLVSQVAVIPLTAVALPTYARLQNAPGELAAAFNRFLAAGGLVALPAFFGMAAVAPVLIPTLFGEQWAGAAPILRILAVLGPEFLATSLLWMIFVALNRTGTAMGLAALQLAINVAAAIVLAPFGLAALVIGHVARAYLFSPVIVVGLGRLAPITNLGIARTLWPSTACAAAMAGLVLAVQGPICAALGPRLGLAAAIGLGMAAYAGLAATFMGGLARSALGLVGSRMAVAETAAS